MMEVLQHAARERIARAIRRARDRQAAVLVSVSAPIAAPEDLLSVVEQAGSPDEHCFLWERPLDRFAIAGLGATATCSAHGANRFTEIAAACNAIMRDAVTDDGADNAAGPIFVGGFAFAPESAEEAPWQGFPAGRLVLPRMLIVRHDRGATLTASLLVDERSDATALEQRLAADLERVQHPAVSTSHNGCAEPTASRYEAATTTSLPVWKQAVADTVGDIAAGRLDKLVLARACTVVANRAFDCGDILRRLRQTYPSCVLFWIGTPQGSFLGATPEPLVRLSGRTVSTAAIAGSAAPGASPEAARALAHALMDSRKDRTEHALVVQAIRTALAPLCDQLDVAPAPQLLRLDNVQHLMTPIAGRLTQPQHILDLVARLHPSPAVAGAPRAAALALLPQREALHRGWYAGPVGWMDARHQGEFAVAIRSALVRGPHASIYAGAGIVAGSDPEAELAETRLKLQPLLAALMEL
jgi:isochorismate synthase